MARVPPACLVLSAVRRYGRLRMQNYGFIMMFVLFLICGVAFPQLTSSAQGLRIFQFLYFFSSFWNQVCTTLGLLHTLPSSQAIMCVCRGTGRGQGASRCA